MESISPALRVAYYQAALRCLQFVEMRKPTGRRFGAEADARWASFQGELTTSDRIDLLLRDADTEWPGTMGARTVFGLRAVAEDEAFGADWEPLDPVDAEELWRGLGDGPHAIGEALEACAKPWGIRLQPVEVGVINPADKLVVVGPSAIASLVSAFSEGQDLDWSDQVLCVATPFGHRHLGAVAGALLNTTRASSVISTVDSEAQFETISRGRRLIQSKDAEPADLELAATFGEEG